MVSTLTDAMDISKTKRTEEKIWEHLIKCFSKSRNIQEAGFCSVMVKRGENVNARIINIQFPITADTKKEQQCERNFSGTIIRGQTAKTARVTNSECDCRRG